MRWAIRIAAVSFVVGAVGIFVLGAFAAEGALHPQRLSVSLVCPCFAHVQCESVAVSAADGVSLKGWYYHSDDPRPDVKAIILLHGVGANRQDMVPLGNFFLHQGYSVLEPDLRGHGESGGFSSYGVLEEGDVRAWLDWLQAGPNGPRVNRIYGFGASLGASVLLESLKHEARFRAVVAESPYFDFPSIARERIARPLPWGLRWVASPFVDSGLAWARWDHSVDLREASPADGLRVSTVPVYLIHGVEDNLTSPDNSRRLAATRPGTELWLVPGSGHADAWATARAEFESRVTGWLARY